MDLNTVYVMLFPTKDLSLFTVPYHTTSVSSNYPSWYFLKITLLTELFQNFRYSMHSTPRPYIGTCTCHAQPQSRSCHRCCLRLCSTVYRTLSGIISNYR